LLFVELSGIDEHADHHFCWLPSDAVGLCPRGPNKVRMALVQGPHGRHKQNLHPIAMTQLNVRPPIAEPFVLQGSFAPLHRQIHSSIQAKTTRQQTVPMSVNTYEINGLKVASILEKPPFLAYI
jgi:hypothetical protein